MIRIVVENVLLFLLPTFLYLAYVFFTRATSGKDENGDTAAAASSLLDDAPLLYLFAAGVLLVIATLVVFGSTTGGKPNQPYVPPSIKDGRIEPGHVQ